MGCGQPCSRLLRRCSSPALPCPALPCPALLCPALPYLPYLPYQIVSRAIASGTRTVREGGCASNQATKLVLVRYVWVGCVCVRVCVCMKAHTHTQKNINKLFIRVYFFPQAFKLTTPNEHGSHPAAVTLKLVGARPRRVAATASVAIRTKLVKKLREEEPVLITSI